MNNPSERQGDGALPLSLEEQIDRLCDEFEVLLRKGESPPAEEFVEQIPTEARAAAVRELLAAEFEYFHAAGHEIDADAYRQRFPEYDVAVNEALYMTRASAVPDESLLATPDRGVGPLSTAPSPGLDNAQSQPSEPILERIGRYEIRDVLGEGGFGRVYRAYDTQLERLVAMKVPGRRLLASGVSVEMLLAEARSAAALKHVGLVAVHDVQVEDDRPYIVQELIDGTDLHTWHKENQPSRQDLIERLIEVTEAVGYAHQQRFVHRDLKPGNILVDRQGHAHVADFGLAVHESGQLHLAGEVSGTPAYMAPEQMRGETHRLDGRSDLWSLGVILYELLVGSRPFAATTHRELYDQITGNDPRPPRQLDPKVPAELERICLKCLEKRRTDRYASAADLLDDLRVWLAGEQNPSPATPESPNPVATPQAVKILPKGLRSFDQHDADFFLELLPGPRDRDGLPTSIRFWKTRIEERDAEQTFSVGLIYGPSGCGKSSLVKAGLLPRLDNLVLSVYVESTYEETEVRLLKALKKRLPDLPETADLPQIFAAIRQNGIGGGRKLLIVLDQFEQWLQAHRGGESWQLVDALRHCDGGNLQCIVMVRDDFWMPATRFMRELEIRLVEAHNSAAVDLFPVRHAEHVLMRFGQAYGTVASGELPPDQRDFVSRSVAGLAQEAKVICVRLALFAEMMKGRPWTLETLREVGGTEGVGVTFLEETFSSRAAPPEHRIHQNAARAVLKALLPESGSDIKGGMQSYDELSETCGYAARPRDFSDLIQILDSELRLITPTDPEGMEDDDNEASQSRESAQRYYQLTHDYLVPSLREWLTRKQKETRRGRAELRLAERAALWNAKPETRHLPSMLEWLTVRRLTDRKQWTVPQRKMMGKAGRVHTLRSVVFTILVVAMFAGGLALRDSINRNREAIVAQKQEEQDEAETTRLVSELLRADTSQVENIIDDLDDYRELAKNDLALAYADPPANLPDARLHAALALLLHDDSVLEFLRDQLLTVSPDQFEHVRDLIDDRKGQLIGHYWQLAQGQQEDPARRFQAACALAKYDPKNDHWKNDEFAQFVAHHLVGVTPSAFTPWRDALREVKVELVGPLGEIFRSDAGESARDLATDTLVDYLQDNPEKLTSLLVDADADAFQSLFPVLAPHRQVAIEELKNVLARRLQPDWKDPTDASWPDVATDAQAAIQSAHGMIGERFAFCQTLPWEDFAELADKLSAAGYRPTRVRPYGVASADTVAAIWTRDGARFALETDLTREQLPAADTPATKDGLVPVDFAVQSAEDASEPRFLILWGEPATEDKQRLLLSDLNEQQLTSAQAALTQAGFASQATIAVWTDEAGQRHYGGIWSNQGAASELNAAYAGFELVDQPQWDVAVARPSKLADPLDPYRRTLAQISALPADRLKTLLEQSQIRLQRGQARFRLRQFEPALEDLDFLVAQDPPSTTALYLRAWTLAALGKPEPSAESLSKYLEIEDDPSQRAYVQIVHAAWSGDHDEAFAQLGTAAASFAEDSGDLYNIACAAALAAQTPLAGDEPSVAERYVDRAIALLGSAITQGYSDGDHIGSDVDLVALHADARFAELLAQIKPPARYAALWRADVEFESRLVTAASPRELLLRVQELVDQDYRPNAIAMLAATADAALHPTLVFHRPIIPDALKEQLAIQQATAATAMLRLEETAQVWPLLEHQADSRLRSYLLHRLAPYEAEAAAVLEQLLIETEASRQRALILAIGELASADRLTDEQRLAATTDLSKRYADDPDAGIHGAAEWTLRQLDADQEIAIVREAYASGQVVGNRQWYLTKEGQQTMVVLDVTEPFLMGSPVTEAERAGGPTGLNEIRHRRLIGRRFAIASHEVTVAQFERFRSDHDFNRIYSREADAPANLINWYDAAAFCNWLSEEEKIPRDQWCYDPDQDFAEGMTLPRDYLERKGYRLPTEAEWEYACRAGSTTARHFGETELLLGQYAWYTKNSGDQWMLPVGSLKPNDAGLFDLLGNVMEWCDDRAVFYQKDRESSLDLGRPGKLDNANSRVLRGGSFTNLASVVRSALRNSNRPDYRYDNLGFRPARTFTP